MKLIVVESPAKGRTIESFLGKDYKVLSSYGHIRDLPKGKLGIDVEKNFEPTYVIPTKARKHVTLLKKESKKANEVILATDEDREGESISFHLKEVLGLKNPKRIVFHEITKSAIEEALQNPRTINEQLVEAQQARRILDRLVGYKLSPFLWKKVARGLSAGRVQSVAVRLVADREREIEAFKPEEYWSLEALLHKLNDALEFSASLVKKDGKAVPKLGIKSKEESEAILQDLKGANWQVREVERKETRRNPLPPFTTSTLQQTAAQRLHFSAKQTMQLAQQLYEMGAITYHRTDSLNLSALAKTSAEKYLKENYGKEYVFPRSFKTRSKGAQEAHEAIRSTSAERTHIKLTGPQAKLYDLIRGRFLASQAAPALFDSASIDIAAASCIFRATGQTLKFDGFLKVYPMKFEETELPPLQKQEGLILSKLLPSQHFTQPPARYTEATLVKMLEEQGIGRPSTYAPTLSTIQERGYVDKDAQRRFHLTELGAVVTDLLVEHFPDIVDAKFTAEMEENLDKIAEGTKEWQPMLKAFYEPFAETLEKKYEDVSKETLVVETGEKCPECGSPLVVRFGRFGKFTACTNFPKCRYTESLEENKPQQLGISCPRCGNGEIVAKRTKRGKIFYACNRYPECDFALWNKPTGEKCEKCEALLVEAGKTKIKCSNKECPSLQKKGSSSTA
ncbi:type I DNA topoisomerase [Patescibacteria group bacterium]|nr:type I DNA topoisomerase [Patescibacteria group bacterium]